MSKTIATVAALAAFVTVGGTVAITLFAKRPDCGVVVGGDIGGPFTLVDGTGTTVTDKDVITEPTLVYFGYTFCPDVCPLDNARNAAAIDILAESGVSATALFISIDPARDTVDVVRDYAGNFHPKMMGLTGSAEQVAAASTAYRTFYKAEDGDPAYYLVQHSTSTYLMFPDTGFATYFGRGHSPEEVAETTACLANIL